MRRTVAALRRNRLTVIVDFHPTGSYKRNLFSSPKSKQNYLLMWERMAREFSALDAGVYFELLNEPGPYREWWGLQGEAIGAIRKADPNRPVVAGAEGENTIKNLIRHTPYRAKGVTYTFHYYDPMPFTHQGADFGSRRYWKVRGVPYPVPIAYSGTGRSWTRDDAATAFGNVAQWARQHSANIFCGEFGVYAGGGVDAVSRANYLRDVRIELERASISWAIWELDGGFGIRRGGEIDHGMIAALGLAYG